LTLTKDFATESGHWYWPDGRTAYEVPYADPNKGMRATTLKDAKKLGLLPSVTGIIRLAAAPGLERWKQEQVLLAAMTLPRLEGEPDADFIARIYHDSKEQGKQAAEAGSKIHGAIESFFQGRSYAPEFLPYVGAVRNAIREQFGKLEWSAEKSFASVPHGYGCKIDLVGPGVVLDYKSKEFDAKNLPKPYDEQLMQLAANGVCAGMPIATMRAANVFISRTIPGLVHVVEHTPEEIFRGWNMFHALLCYWKAKNS